MRAGLLALSAAGAAVVLAAGPVAADGGSVAVNPYAVPPGTDVDLRVTGCEGTTGRAYSDAFVSPGVLAPSADQPTLFAEARVKSSTAPGNYEIKVTCDGIDAKVKGTVRVLDGRTSPSPTPTAPVHAGGGGAAAQLAAAQPQAQVEEDGPGTRHAVIGLVLAAVAAVAVAFRSVRRRRSAQD
ncbi:hypothetical protein ACIBUY_10700 [Streptomyces sp. NPDC050085]|uniref:hypothetical protein n=1 Tax=Streptomyces sp. NPDC050085 TaxID=3365600 RepID=UPI0037B36405